jgi:hypothetical protein
MSEPNSNAGWPELRQLWSDIRNRRATGWPPGRALEYLVIRAFELDGARVRPAFGVGIQGAPIEQLDGAVYAAGLSCIVECKDRRAPLNAEPVAKMRSQLLRRPAGTVGLLFSRSGYHDSATALARYSAHEPILLWYADEITHMLEHENPCRLLQRKYRLCVEEAAPHTNTFEEST